MAVSPERIDPQSVFLATWVLAPAGVHAMGRPPQAGDPLPEEYSQRRPHLVPPDELTTHVGNCCYAPLGTFHISDEDDIRDLAVAQADHPWGGVQDVAASGSDWLGVFLHTPHYQTQALAVKPAERNMCAVTRVIHRHSSELAAQTFDTIVSTQTPAIRWVRVAVTLFKRYQVHRSRRPGSHRFRPHPRRGALLCCSAPA